MSSPLFSRRTAWDTAPSPFAAALARARARGHPLLDLTETNPTALGLCHPPEVYRALLGEGEAITRYSPESRGLAAAREAIAGYYEARARARDRDPPALAIDPGAVTVFATTSEAYSALFAILADPGDAVLVPRPSYPLLDYLAALAGVTLVPYRIAYDGAWHLDLGDLRRVLAATPRVRAIVAIAPNNPTGNYLDRPTIAAIYALAAARGLALIVDEVFFDYPVEPPERAPISPIEAGGDALLFTLSGLAKVAGLPQMKLAWAVSRGPTAAVAEATARLEVVCDTFLSAATPVQRATPAFLAAAPALQATIRARLATNYRALREACRGSAVTPTAVEAGWTALLRLPAIGRDDATWARALIDEAGVVIQPGYFYDFCEHAGDRGPFLALSLLTPPAELARGIDRIVDLVARRIAD